MRFYNISNHPSANWSDKQKKAAIKLAVFEHRFPEDMETDPATEFSIKDIPFPEIPPKAGTETIASLLFDVLEQLPESGKTEEGGRWVVFAAGQFFANYLLVDELHRRGFCVVEATTTRNTVDLPDGKKQVCFDFCLWREIVPSPEGGLDKLLPSYSCPVGERWDHE